MPASISPITDNAMPWSACRARRRAGRVLCAGVAACFGVGLAGCGGGSGETVAQLGRQTITKVMINQWMAPTIEEDFYAVATHPAPPRLVSEPANYPACVTALKRITPIPGGQPRQPQPTTANLENRCHALYQAIRYQTTGYLIGSYWLIAFAEAHGLKVTEQEIQAKLAPNKQELQASLTAHHLTLPQQLFRLKLQLLQNKLLEPAFAQGKAALATITTAMKTSTITATCQAEYIVEHCRQYKTPGGYPGKPPAVQLQEIARWRPETSHGYTGQPLTP
jgi:hypothetical protein